MTDTLLAPAPREVAPPVDLAARRLAKQRVLAAADFADSVIANGPANTTAHGLNSTQLREVLDNYGGFSAAQRRHLDEERQRLIDAEAEEAAQAAATATEQHGVLSTRPTTGTVNLDGRNMPTVDATTLVGRQTPVRFATIGGRDAADQGPDEPPPTTPPGGAAAAQPPMSELAAATARIITDRMTTNETDINQLGERRAEFARILTHVDRIQVEGQEQPIVFRPDASNSTLVLTNDATRPELDDIIPLALSSSLPRDGQILSLMRPTFGVLPDDQRTISFIAGRESPNTKDRWVIQAAIPQDQGNLMLKIVLNDQADYKALFDQFVYDPVSATSLLLENTSEDSGNIPTLTDQQLIRQATERPFPSSQWIPRRNFTTMSEEIDIVALEGSLIQPTSFIADVDAYRVMTASTSEWPHYKDHVPVPQRVDDGAKSELREGEMIPIRVQLVDVPVGQYVQNADGTVAMVSRDEDGNFALYNTQDNQQLVAPFDTSWFPFDDATFERIRELQMQDDPDRPDHLNDPVDLQHVPNDWYVLTDGNRPYRVYRDESGRVMLADQTRGDNGDISYALNPDSLPAGTRWRPYNEATYQAILAERERRNAVTAEQPLVDNGLAHRVPLATLNLSAADTVPMDVVEDPLPPELKTALDNVIPLRGKDFQAFREAIAGEIDPAEIDRLVAALPDEDLKANYEDAKLDVYTREAIEQIVASLRRSPIIGDRFDSLPATFDRLLAANPSITEPVFRLVEYFDRGSFQILPFVGDRSAIEAVAASIQQTPVSDVVEPVQPATRPDPATRFASLAGLHQRKATVDEDTIPQPLVTDAALARLIDDDRTEPISPAGPTGDRELVRVGAYDDPATFGEL